MAGSVHKVHYCQTQIYHSNAMTEHCRCREGLDLAVAAGIMLIKKPVWWALKYSYLTSSLYDFDASTVYTADNTGSLMKTATVCRVKCISVIVLSVEMAQSTRHLKWTRNHLRWTFVYLDGHHKNLFGTWASLNHRIPTTTPSLFMSSAFASITHTHTHTHSLFPGIMICFHQSLFKLPHAFIKTQERAKLTTYNMDRQTHPHCADFIRPPWRDYCTLKCFKEVRDLKMRYGLW